MADASGNQNTHRYHPNPDEFSTNADIDRRLVENDLRFANIMQKYQYDLGAAMDKYSDEINDLLKEYHAGAIESEKKSDKAINNFKYWVIAVGVGIVATILGVMLTVDSSQNDAFLAGHDMRASTRSMVEATETKTEKEISTLKEKLEHLEMLLKENQKNN